MIKQATTEVLNFIDSRAVVRRLTLLFTLYMTWWISREAWVFAHSSTFDGMGTAAVIAAIMAPTAALQAFAFNTYTKSRAE